MIDKDITEVKSKEMRHCELGFYSELPYHLCRKISDKLNQLDVSQIVQEKLIIYLNLLAVVDTKTAEHSMRAALLCERIGQEINVDNKALFFAGLLHDEGKVLVPTYILNKSENFGQDDMEIIKEHPLNTFKLLGDVFEFSALVASRHHKHQHNGYPEKLPPLNTKYSKETEDTICFYSKILSIADFFDAAVSRNNNKFNKNGVLDINEVYKELINRYPKDIELVNRLNNSEILSEHLKLLK